MGTAPRVGTARQRKDARTIEVPGSDYKHVTFGEDGRALVAGTTMKVSELILEHLANGWPPGELKLQHPYLSLAQIHAAFTHHYDHQAAMDQAMAEERRRVEALRAEAQATSPLYRWLRQALP